MARTYIIEMIAFTNEGGSAERWNFESEQSVARRNKVNSIFTRAEGLNSGENLSYLDQVYSAIAGNAEHRILKTERWTQESATYDSSPLVKITSTDLCIKGGVGVYAPNLLFAELNLMFTPNADSLALYRNQRPGSVLFRSTSATETWRNPLLWPFQIWRGTYRCPYLSSPI
jgi:hypothetical protein